MNKDQIQRMNKEQIHLCLEMVKFIERLINRGWYNLDCEPNIHYELINWKNLLPSQQKLMRGDKK